MISDDELSDVYELVWQARCDHRVWKGGVNEAYLNFIATKPAPSISAVLLSIIWIRVNKMIILYENIEYTLPHFSKSFYV